MLWSIETPSNAATVSRARAWSVGLAIGSDHDVHRRGQSPSIGPFFVCASPGREETTIVRPLPVRRKRLAAGSGFPPRCSGFGYDGAGRPERTRPRSCERAGILRRDSPPATGPGTLATESEITFDRRVPLPAVRRRPRGAVEPGQRLAPLRSCGRAGLPRSRSELPVTGSPDARRLGAGPGRACIPLTSAGSPASRPCSWRSWSALVALLEQSRLGAAVFTLIALACLAFSIYPVRHRVA